MENSTAEVGVEEEVAPETEVTPAVEPEPVAEDSHPETEEGEEQEEVEMMDFDFGGNKLSVPKDSVPEELASEIDRFTKGTWSDYTKKAGAVAEATKSLEARESAVQKLEQLHGETLDTYGRGIAIKKELEQLGTVDLTSLWQSDPDQARRVSDTISQKQAEFNSIIAEVSKQENNLSQARTVETKRRMDEGEKIVEKQIPGFGAKVPEVTEYVTQNFGVSKADAEQWALNPGGAIMAYESMLYRKMTAKAKSKARPVVPDAVPVKPMKTKGGKQVRPLNGNISADEYAKRWQAQQKRNAS